MNKILVIRFSSLGDIILSFPLLKKLREKYPQSEIHFLTKKDHEKILKINPDINRIIVFNESISGIRKILKEEKYDLVIDIHKNFRSILSSVFTGSEIVRYKKENFKKILLVKFKIDKFKTIAPVFQKYILTVKDKLGIEDTGFTVSELLFSKDNIIGEKYIVIAPATRHFTKTFPAEKFIEYISSRSDRKYVLVGDNTENDKNICSQIESKCPNVLNLCGKLDMQALANVLYNSDYVICNDSAILHYAEALGKKVTAIFGSTVRQFGFFPVLENSSVVENKGLYCRPCTHIGRSSCPEKHFRCMIELDLDKEIKT